MSNPPQYPTPSQQPAPPVAGPIPVQRPGIGGQYPGVMPVPVQLPKGGSRRKPAARRWWQRKPTSVGQPPAAAGGRAGTATTPPPAAVWRAPQRHPLLARLGVYELRDDPILTSTRQGECLNPALVSTHPPLSGPLLGVDIHTGQPVCVDPHELYAAQPRRVSAPNVAVLGDVGNGKSALVKCQYVLRPLALGRTVAVFDRKRQSGRGEYGAAAAVAGCTVVRFDRNGGAVVNLLDPRISVADQSEARTGGDLVGQDRLLLMVAEHAVGRDLHSRERAALRAAHQAALHRARDAGRVAVLADVIQALYNPDESAVPRPELLERGLVGVNDVFNWGLDLALDLERFVKGDLSGLIDGETRGEDGGELDLSARLLVIDTSALDEDSPALALIMAVMSTYLSAVWSQTPGQRIIVVEEGYHTATMTGVASVFRSLAKRGRGIGLALVYVVHHISDVPHDSPAMAMIREAGVMHIFKQSRADDAGDCVRLLRLPESMIDQLGYLEPGTHVLLIEREPGRIVAALRTPLEVEVTDTDSAMTSATAAEPVAYSMPANIEVRRED